MTPSTSTTGTARRRGDGGQSRAVRTAVDWVIPALLVLAGVVAAGVGVVVSGFADGTTSEDLVAGMETPSTLVSESVLVDAVHNFLVWGSTALLLLGLVYAVAGVGFGYYRSRLSGGIGARSAVFAGAAVTALVSFVPFSSVLGGGVVGYLQRHRGDDAARLGVVAGILASVPRVLVVGSLALGALAAGATPIAGILGVALVVGVSAILTLSGFGAYLGTKLGA